MLNKKIIDELTKPLPVFSMPKTGYPYVKIQDVIDKLNKAFDYNWSTDLKEIKESDSSIICIIELIVPTEDGNIIKKLGIGGTKKTYKRDGKTLLDLSNDYYVAFTSSLKAAVKQLGLSEKEKSPKDKKVANNSFKSPKEFNNERSSATVGSKPIPQPKSKPMSSSLENKPQQSNIMPKTIPEKPNTSLGNGKFNTTLIQQTKKILKEKGKSASTAGMGADLVSQTIIDTENKTKPLKTKVQDGQEVGIDSFPPPVSSVDKISTIQKTALTSLATRLNKSPRELIKGALPDTEHVDFDDLNKKEAVMVIKFANQKHES